MVPALDDRIVIVISGPGGVGKGTIVRQLLERDDRLWLSRSWTTREPRPGEAPDAYVFTDRETFEVAVDDGGFLEWVEFLDYLQGTPLPSPPPGHDVVLEIDVYGAQQIRQVHAGALLVFVDAPSRDHQANRMRGRGDAESEIAARLAKADDEALLADALGCVRVVNDELGGAVVEIEKLIADSRQSI